jgi:hypothetical protein
MRAIVFAAPGDQLLMAEKILAIVGGAVVGALALGLLAQLLIRAFTTQKMPRWPLLVVRLLGGVIGGWLVALWVLGGGGAGFGGLGGWGLGSGPGKGPETNEVAKKEGENGKKSGENETPRNELVQIEVLGNATLAEADVKAQRRYRMDTGEGSRLLSFEETKEAIKKRQQQLPPLSRLEIVLYKDSPEEHVAWVSQLERWSRDLNDGKLKVDIRKRGTNAPAQ